MKRRTFLVGTGLVSSPLLGGCLGKTTADPSTSRDDATDSEPSTNDEHSGRPEYECEQASRPKPSAPDRKDAVEPKEYPEKPETLNEHSVRGFVAEYERAYLRNSKVEKYGDELKSADESIKRIRGLEERNGGFIVRLHGFTGSTIEDEHGTSVGHGPVYTKYFVDEYAVFRAETDYDWENADEVNPREDGELLECFEQESGS